MESNKIRILAESLEHAAALRQNTTQHDQNQNVGSELQHKSTATRSISCASKHISHADYATATCARIATTAACFSS